MNETIVAIWSIENRRKGDEYEDLKPFSLIGTQNTCIYYKKMFHLFWEIPA